MRFTDIKSETLNLRVSPTFKRILQEAASHEQRSMVNMLEVLLGDYCDRKGIVQTAEKATTPTRNRSGAARRAHAGVAV